LILGSNIVIDPATADRLSKLPEEILAQILSFLPAQEAIRTCVLAWTWRDVWKFTRRLRITGDSVHEVREFVDRLLAVRLDGLKLASLEASEISFDPSKEFVDVDDEPYIYRTLPRRRGHVQPQQMDPPRAAGMSNPDAPG
jgi:hypothetical protein